MASLVPLRLLVKAEQSICHGIQPSLGICVFFSPLIIRLIFYLNWTIMDIWSCFSFFTKESYWSKQFSASASSPPGMQESTPPTKKYITGAWIRLFSKLVFKSLLLLVDWRLDLFFTAYLQEGWWNAVSAKKGYNQYLLYFAYDKGIIGCATQRVYSG